MSTGTTKIFVGDGAFTEDEIEMLNAALGCLLHHSPRWKARISSFLATRPTFAIEGDPS